jgi:hypothetical protein
MPTTPPRPARARARRRICDAPALGRSQCPAQPAPARSSWRRAGPHCDRTGAAPPPPASALIPRAFQRTHGPDVPAPPTAPQPSPPQHPAPQRTGGLRTASPPPPRHAKLPKKIMVLHREGVLGCPFPMATPHSCGKLPHLMSNMWYLLSNRSQ